MTRIQFQPNACLTSNGQPNSIIGRAVCRHCLLGIDLERVESPVGSAEVLRHVADVLLARLLASDLLAAISPSTLSPATAEVGIDNDALILDVLGHVASGTVLAVKSSNGSAPRRGVGRLAKRSIVIRRDILTLPEPDMDVVSCPLHGVHTTLVVVEAPSKGLGVVIIGVTASSLLLQAVIPPVLLGLHGRVGSDLALALVFADVERHLVLRCVVGIFDDIDLSLFRPMSRRGRPESGPCTAGIGLQVSLAVKSGASKKKKKGNIKKPGYIFYIAYHMSYISHEQGARVVGLSGRQTKRHAATTSGFPSAVDAQVDSTIVGRD